MTDTALAPLARRLISLLDLTSLNASDDDVSIRSFVRGASTEAGNVAAVCTWPRLVPAARAGLRGSGIAVAAVANFPAGDLGSERAASECAAAIEAGASEIDVVFPYREFLAGNPRAGGELVRACRAACGDRALLKVILETGQLGSSERIRQAARVAIDAGAHFLKTSTGKTEPGATLAAAEALLDTIVEAAGRGRSVGLKVSGGVRTLEQARSYLELYESRQGEGSAQPSNFRIGASSLTQELLATAMVRSGAQAR
jgi:deoxyribose-phosphate aldolase